VDEVLSNKVEYVRRNGSLIKSEASPLGRVEIWRTVLGNQVTIHIDPQGRPVSLRSEQPSRWWKTQQFVRIVFRGERV